jgi:hypothetical protein
MPSIPPECQPIADEIDELQNEIEGLQNSLPGLAGDGKFKELATINRLVTLVIQKKSDLTQCLRQGPGYETDVTIIDICSPTTVLLPAEVRMWKLNPAGQVVDETQSLQSGHIKFSRPGTIPGWSIGISVQDAPNPTLTGPLFRSGPLSSLPAGAPGNPAGLIEILVPCFTAVTATTLTARLPATPFKVDQKTTVNSIMLGLGTGGVTLTLGLTGAVLGSIVTVSFTYTLTFTIVPSFDLNNSAEVCVAVPSGPGTITGGGVLGFLIPPEPVIRGSIVRIVQSLLNNELRALAASSLGFSTLPSGVVLSMRRVVHRPTDILFFPAFGAFGGVPTARPSPECRVIRLDIGGRRLEIERLHGGLALLDPRDMADRREIQEIKKAIATLRGEITNLEKRAASLGCP